MVMNMLIENIISPINKLLDIEIFIFAKIITENKIITHMFKIGMSKYSLFSFSCKTAIPYLNFFFFYKNFRIIKSILAINNKLI